MAAILTNIVCNVVAQFGKNVQASAEVDDRPIGYNYGKSSFMPGEDVYMLLFMPYNYEVKFSTCSSGTLASTTKKDTKLISEVVQFVDTDSFSPSYPMDKLTDDPTPSPEKIVWRAFNQASKDFVPFIWMGPSLGALTRQNEFLASLPPRTRDNNGKPNPLHRIGVGTYIFGADCEVWKLSGVIQPTKPTYKNPIISTVICYWVVGEVTAP
jgi:hypothetical protein